MNAEEMIKKHLEGEKLENLMKEFKENNVNFANEKNLYIRYSKIKNDIEKKTSYTKKPKSTLKSLVKE